MAACQLDALKDCLDYELLTNALTSLPKTLDETYDRILDSIPECHRRKARRILQFLAFETRAPRIEEMVDALTVDLEGEQYFDPRNRMPEPLEISRYCSSLVIRASNQVVLDKDKENDDDNTPTIFLQLAHSSVKEYLTSSRVHKAFRRDFEETTAKESIMQVCEAYLRHLNQDPDLKWVLCFEQETRFPFAYYCASHWIRHSRTRDTELFGSVTISLIDRCDFDDEMAFLWRLWNNGNTSESN